MSGLPEPEYANPPVPHEVNVAEKTPLADFLRLFFGTLLLGLVVVLGVYFLARLFAPKIPFAWEEAVAANFVDAEKARPACWREGEAALQTLADQLAGSMPMPPGVRVQVHFSADKMPNAFATLGGHIVIFRGLINHVDSENALSLVLAHEIAHVMNRDPIVSLGGGVTVAVVLSVLIGGSDGGTLISWALGLSQMRFSREQEMAADQAALRAVGRRYGTTKGAEAFFVWMMDHEGERPEFLSTHPATPERIGHIRSLSTAEDTTELTPLPPAIAALRRCYAETAQK
ncbi:MAG: M48 family metallopeptidase [Zoogloeaceae bacterium]|jgi:Zn-dependent protease with chaperone function|nr:M48 family metallopeptidase [Zoogloeaceae bacterium]